MTKPTIRRSWIVGLAAAAIALLAPGIAHAAPPSNDDFDNATAITALPFRTTQDASEATTAPDDPPECLGFGGRSVWFRYTAAEAAIVTVTASSPTDGSLLAAFTGQRGQLTLIPGVCAFGRAETFHVAAGTTYHFLVTTFARELTLELKTVPPAPNDDFAAAQPVPALPAAPIGDLARASGEPNEAPASCAGTAVQSVWYTYTPPTTRSVSFSTTATFFSPAVTVYRGNALTELTEVDCVRGSVAVFRATAGETYRIRVASAAADAGVFVLHGENAPQIRPSVSTSPSQPSVFDDIEFFPFAGDQLGKQLVSGEVRFGDGASAPITGEPIRHRYAADGVYQVEVTGATADGRTGTGTSTLEVETHDVSVATFTVPAGARAGQTKPISVHIANTRYGEEVEVELLRQSGDFFVHIGTLTQFVPARPDRTVEFPFAYTYSEPGTVTFKAVARLRSFSNRDARPADNEKLATTTVRQ